MRAVGAQAVRRLASRRIHQAKLAYVPNLDSLHRQRVTSEVASYYTLRRDSIAREKVVELRWENEMEGAAAAFAPRDMIFETNGHVRTLGAIETEIIGLAMAHYQGSCTTVARRLGISRSSLYRKLERIEAGPDRAR